MKAVVNGYRYNTKHAVKIGTYKTPEPESNFCHWEATLYKTRNIGNYFLVGSGMHMTRFGTASGKHVWEPGEALTPMTRETAREWAEAYLAPDIFREEFGE